MLGLAYGCELILCSVSPFTEQYYQYLTAMHSLWVIIFVFPYMPGMFPLQDLSNNGLEVPPCTSIVLYCIVLYCIVLYCIALHCAAVLHCIVLYCIVFTYFRQMMIYIGCPGFAIVLSVGYGAMD